MPTGRCACGDYTYEISDNPTGTLVCHCIPCRKFAGSNGSTNAIVPKEKYKLLSGEVKTWTRQGDSGKSVTNNYCAKCSDLMVVDAECMPDSKIFKVGTLDDQDLLDKMPVTKEVYTRHRPNYIGPCKNAQQQD